MKKILIIILLLLVSISQIQAQDAISIQTCTKILKNELAKKDSLMQCECFADSEVSAFRLHDMTTELHDNSQFHLSYVQFDGIQIINHCRNIDINNTSNSKKQIFFGDHEISIDCNQDAKEIIRIENKHTNLSHASKQLICQNLMIQIANHNLTLKGYCDQKNLLASSLGISWFEIMEYQDSLVNSFDTKTIHGSSIANGKFMRRMVYELLNYIFMDNEYSNIKIAFYGDIQIEYRDVILPIDSKNNKKIIYYRNNDNVYGLHVKDNLLPYQITIHERGKDGQMVEKPLVIGSALYSSVLQEVQQNIHDSHIDLAAKSKD